jgi:hypothetical protein
MHKLRNLFASAATAAALALTGCTATVPTAPLTSQQGSDRYVAAQRARANGPLLYVAHVVKHGGHYSSVLSILSLQGKTVGAITDYRYISGVCADAAGNVWVPNQRHRWYVDEFAHGGTTAIAELRPPRRWSILSGCAVDPVSGDLAVMGANIDGAQYAIIWSGARSGKPAMYHVPFYAAEAAYDDVGDLFITGPAGGSISEYFFAFGELAKGSGHVKRIQLDKKTGHPGGVQWDGSYVVVGTTQDRDPPRGCLYRVQVSGAKGRVVNAVFPKGLDRDLYPSAPVFVLHGDAVIGVAGTNGEGVWAWPYPAGGKPTQSLGSFETIQGVAISK